MKPVDWPEVRKIYREGIETGLATFETEVPEWSIWDKNHLKRCRFTALQEETITGWCALSPVSLRPAYSGVAEVSVYVGKNARGRGMGRALLEKLVRESESSGIWTLQAGIFPENEASINLHKKSGFREVGIRKKIGRLHGKWKDVVLLERRSNII